MREELRSRLAYSHGDRLIGIHLNMMPLRRDPKMVANPTSEERKYLEELATWLKEETGYQWIRGTRPQTLAFALTDSPIGLAAWIIEKFRAWSDCGGELESLATAMALPAGDLGQRPSSTSLATIATRSGSNPNFFCNSLSGAEAPKVCMPTTLPFAPT